MTLPKLYTVEEVAASVQMHPTWVRRRVKDGTLPYIRAGHKLRFTEEHVKALSKSLEVVPIDQGITAGRRRKRYGNDAA